MTLRLCGVEGREMVGPTDPEPDDDDGAWMRAEEWDEFDDEPTFEKWRRGQGWS